VGTFVFNHDLLVAADAGAGAGADLGDAAVDEFVAEVGFLAGGENHAGVGHGQADGRDDFLEGFIGYEVGESLQVNGTGRAHTGHGDGVGADAEFFFQVFGVEEHGHGFVFPVIEAVEHADAHIVDAGFLSPVHSGGVPVVIVLGSGGMELGVGIAVVGFLEENVGTDFRSLEFLVVLNSGGGDIDIHATDGTIAVLDAVDGLDGVSDIFDGVMNGVLTGFHG